MGEHASLDLTSKAVSALMIDGLTYVPLTDIGVKRSENQDYQGHDLTPMGLLFVVADGMGGHAGGATASQMAVNHIKRSLRTSCEPSCAQALRDAIQRANYEIWATSQDRFDLRGMGSTVVAMIITEHTAHIAHVGDSRIYLLRDDTFMQLTKDHTMAQRMFDDGLLSQEAVKTHPTSHVLSRSLGGTKSVQIEVAPYPLRLKEGDRFIMCSDGLTGPVEDWEISKILRERELHDAARILVDLANERGGPDNTTVALIQIDALPIANVRTDALPPSPNPEAVDLADIVAIEEEAPAEETPAEETPAEETPAEETPPAPPTDAADAQADSDTDDDAEAERDSAQSTEDPPEPESDEDRAPDSDGAPELDSGEEEPVAAAEPTPDSAQEAAASETLEGEDLQGQAQDAADTEEEPPTTSTDDPEDEASTSATAPAQSSGPERWGEDASGAEPDRDGGSAVFEVDEHGAIDPQQFAYSVLEVSEKGERQVTLSRQPSNEALPPQREQGPPPQFLIPMMVVSTILALGAGFLFGHQPVPNLEVELSNTQSGLQQSAREIKELQTTIEARDLSNNDLRETGEGLAAERDALKNKVEELHTAVKARDKVIEDLRGQVEPEPEEPEGVQR